MAVGVPLPSAGDKPWTDWGAAIHAQADAVAGKADAAAIEALVMWTGSAWPTRPSGYARVRWVGGTVQPAAMATGDVWEHDA